MTEKERRVMEEIVHWFTALKSRDHLNDYEHALFIAAADLLWNREQAPMSVEQFLDSENDETLSLSPSFIESIRVFAMGGSSRTHLTRLPPVLTRKTMETTTPPPSLAAQFDMQGLPPGAHLAQPRLPTFDSEPVSTTLEELPVLAPPSELPTLEEQAPPTVRNPTRTRALASLIEEVHTAEWDEPEDT